MTNRKILKVERLLDGSGLRVVMLDGTSATYANAAQVPDDVAGLLSRLDAADGGDGGQEGQGDAGTAQAAYRQRLEAAHEQGRIRHDPGQGLTGEAAYRARLEGAWAAPPPSKGVPADRKRWQGA